MTSEPHDEEDRDRELIERFRRGEATAFDELFTRYGPRLYKFALRLTGGAAADAEDLAQEVFLAAYIGLPFFEGRSSLATYLYKIMMYRWRRMRLQRERSAEMGRHRISLENGWGRDPALLGLARIELREALAALPAACREAFLLVKGEGLTSREAADALGIPEGTVKYHVAEAATGRRTIRNAPWLDVIARVAR